MDYKGIYLPERNDLLLGRVKDTVKFSTGDDKSKNTVDDIDDEWMSLPFFLKLAMKGETVALDMLHATDDDNVERFEYGHIWDSFVAHREKFYTKNLKAYMGYVKKQAAKYGVKGSRLAVMETALNLAKNDFEAFNDPNVTLGNLMNQMPIGEHSAIVTSEHPTIGTQTFYEICGRKFQDTSKLPYFIENLQKIYDSYGERAQAAKNNEGIDWKATSHALRAGYQLRDIYTKGTFSYPLDQTDFLRDVKAGNLDFTSNVGPALEDLVQEIEAMVDGVTFPDNVDSEYWDSWLLATYDNDVLRRNVDGSDGSLG